MTYRPGPIYAVLRYSLVGLLACTPPYKFTPNGATFPPAEREVAVLEEAPADPYDVIGYVEVQSESMGKALPYLKKAAQDHGGDAILKIESAPVYFTISTYRAAVIKYRAP